MNERKKKKLIKRSLCKKRNKQTIKIEVKTFDGKKFV